MLLSISSRPFTDPCVHLISFLVRPSFGTTAYASPEIITGHTYYASEAEVWSLGILLCILVTGESPFASPKEAQIGKRSQLRNGLKMSRELNDLVERCLQVAPERRITIEEMRGHRWLSGH